MSKHKHKHPPRSANRFAFLGDPGTYSDKKTHTKVSAIDVCQKRPEEERATAVHISRYILYILLAARAVYMNSSLNGSSDTHPISITPRRAAAAAAAAAAGRVADAAIIALYLRHFFCRCPKRGVRFQKFYKTVRIALLSWGQLTWSESQTYSRFLYSSALLAVKGLIV